MIDVLVVDDDFRVAQVHADFVERVPGLRVVARAHTAAAALQAAERRAPALVLLDLYLPDMDGLEVLRRVRAPRRDGRSVPDALLLTAAREMGHVRQAMALGALHYLVKPVDFGALRERLEAYAELHAHRRREGEVDQGEIDRLFGLMRRGGSVSAALPAGRVSPTAERIVAELRAAGDSLSALEMAERIGVSRATAQRYLSTLARSEVVALELRYGTTGRPEHRYRLAAG